MRITIITNPQDSKTENILMRLTLSRKSLIQKLKDLFSKAFNMPTSLFHLESYILTQKILLSESFPLSFYFSDKNISVFIILHSVNCNKFQVCELMEEAKKAVMKDKPEELVKILEQWEDLRLVDEIDNNGWGLIHFASVQGKDLCLRKLVLNGANLNLVTNDEWTPLGLAAAHAQAACLTILLRSPGVQMNKMTKKGSALHIAVQYNHIDIVSLLLNAGASIILENNLKQIPLELAKDIEIIELIPKFQGMRDLEKYSNKSKPANFSGKLTKLRTFKISDRKVFLNINLNSGLLEEYFNKSDFFTYSCPNYTFQLSTIEYVGAFVKGVRKIKSISYFEVSLVSGKRIYYTKDEAYRDKWVEQLCEAINYCQVYKRVTICEAQINSENENEEVDFGLDENSEKLKDNFEIVQEIGSGSYGEVHKVVEKDTGLVFALKSLSKPFMKRKEMLKYAISEIKIMQKLVHPFVISMKCAFEDSSTLYLILEYCSGGDLEALLSKKKLPSMVARATIAEIILGLEYIHSMDIIYRDLKPANILIDIEGHIKLADFGLATPLEHDFSIISTLVGSPAYISPEILIGEKLGKKSDIYSLGVVIHEILTGTLPFEYSNIDLIFSNIKNGKFFFSKELNKAQLDLIKKLMQRKPEKRPDFEEIKAHNFFQGLDWKSVENKTYITGSLKSTFSTHSNL